jgi:hypothetical protein
MEIVTIHSYAKQWSDARIVTTGKDSILGTRDIFMVRHPAFEYDVEFYATPDEQGRHLNVGNNSFWITRGQS